MTVNDGFIIVLSQLGTNKQRGQFDEALFT